MGPSDDGIVFAIIIVVSALILLFTYFLPSYIAFERDHRNRLLIFLCNLLLGGTLVAWVVCLIWAMSSNRQARVRRKEPRLTSKKMRK